ncbi:hypothetical protein [Paenibacillus sp. YN15]|uniref:hypothetical protein n=1 Tax=Paenibacillus sp. YN15 TaxID=1742774 RepID=UPI000DCE771D|nr:hypothetical protein [Paenibacillus sp. YN15]RAU92174.1 hypothetical protein DQG13_28065 [Paenibacillus sp. YN15]
MGIKMPKAYHKMKDKIVSIDVADNEMNGFLLCQTPECRVPVIYVDAYKKRYADKTVLVAPYFRLVSNDKPHLNECKYNTLGQVKVIARDSDDNVLRSIEEGHYSFRLNVIDETLRTLNQLAKDESESEESAPWDPKPPAKVYTNQGKLDSYLSTMQKIMKLRSLTETHDELREIISLQYGKRSIRWSRFYYTSDDFKKCYTYIKRNSVTHPLCLEGIIKEIEPPKEKFKFHVLKLRFPWVEPDKDGIVNLIAVELIIQNDKVLNYIQSNSNLNNAAVYSKFHVNESKVHIKQYQGGIKKKRFLNIKGNLYHPKQIVLF